MTRLPAGVGTTGSRGIRRAAAKVGPRRVVMRLRGILFESFVTGFSGAAMPGPVLAATVVLAAAQGFWAGPLVVVGHGLIEVPLVIAILAGLHRCLSRPDAPVVRAIGLVGGLVLLVMAGDMLRSLPALSLQHPDPPPFCTHPVRAGLILSALNPYFWIWWATIGLGLLTESYTRRGRTGSVAFYAGHIAADFVWYALVAGLIASGGRLLSDAVYRALIAVCAALLLVFGARFLWFSARPPHQEPAADA